mmetsp:Transcript_23702/g.36605  ORF Transcript_23702/g.36605 Transcript_23702/m.36605 type:complete len:303 (-) Transcript_23702:4-912(-)|eukprot:CAMPEP_0195304878 /NCGR_PEP_ID=MMETSP0707-20130614/35284_1 /TAXON_ID=33640 /ORGANISM="Asterionellopsis glacialis, Strain CCMP134" /LENGTH=302 /DNA_ID=CAMNT_0040368835 /DNA_START=432 /DNA_END=1340 /DNA_ORIENTATION=+
MAIRGTVAKSLMSSSRAALMGGLCLIFAVPFLLSNKQSNNGVLRLSSINSIEPTLNMHKPGAYQGIPWKTDRTVSTKVLGETPFARCDIHSVKSVDGSDVIRDWLFMEERDAINVAVYTAEGKFLVFEQEKYAIHGKTLSPVGGLVDDGESPFDAARREVMEELGVGSKRTWKELQQINNSDMPDKKKLYSQPLVLDENNEKDGSVPGREPDWIFLGKYRTAANRGGGFSFTYLLLDAVPVAEGGGTAEYIRTGDAEPQTLKELSMDEMSYAVQQAQFQEIKWTATLSLSLLHMQNRKAMQK